MYALIGAGIASFYMAYQYTNPPTGRAEPPPEFAPYLFGGIGIVCLIIAGILTVEIEEGPDAGRHDRSQRPGRQDGHPPHG